jgi:hypothetical protein
MDTSDDGACEALTADHVGDWVARAAGSKANFFRLLQQGTRPFNLSGVRHVVPRAEQLLSTTVRIAFVGDSMMRELSFAWHALAPHSMAQYVWAESASLENPAVRAVLHALRADCAFDGVFVGAGLHRLSRGKDCISSHYCTPLNESRAPYDEHIELTRGLLAGLSDVAAAASRPIAYVGTMPPDAITLLLEPRKVGWHSFYDFSLAELWASAERELEQTERTTLDRHLRFLHPSTLAARCRGVRCDGMHFFSDMPSVNCAGSLHLYFGFLRRWIVSSGWLHMAEQAGRRRQMHCNTSAMRCSDQAAPVGSARPLPWRLSGARNSRNHALGLTLGSHCYDEYALPIARMTPWLAHKYKPDAEEVREGHIGGR